MGNGKSGPCQSCVGGDFEVVFGDGRGDTGNASCTADADGGIPPQCQVAAQCSTLGMGTEGDGDDFLDPSLAGGAGSAITGAGVRTAYPGTCDMDFADDVAYWNYHSNSGTTATPETLKTYVVAIGDPDNTYGEMSSLMGVGANGGGTYYVADNFQCSRGNLLRTSLRRLSIEQRPFSSASVTTVQSQGYTSAFIPRFIPSIATQWQGQLEPGLKFFNEFLGRLFARRRITGSRTP